METRLTQLENALRALLDAIDDPAGTEVGVEMAADEARALLDGEGAPAAAADPVNTQRRLNAVGVIIGASELVGAHGLHLTAREVDEMPEDVQKALHVLGVTEAEYAAADTGEVDD